MPDWFDLYGITDPEQRAFLNAYATIGSKAKAAQSIHISYERVRRWEGGDKSTRERKSGPTAEQINFKEALQEAKEFQIENLEREARRRAFNGSDILLIFLLKAARPERYRDKYLSQVQDQRPTVQQNIQVNVSDMQKPEHLKQVIGVAKQVGALDKLLPKVIDAEEENKATVSKAVTGKDRGSRRAESPKNSDAEVE